MKKCQFLKVFWCFWPRRSVGHALLDGCLRRLLGHQLAAQQFGNGFADVEFAEMLQVGQRIKHEDAVHQPVGMFRFAPGTLRTPCAPAGSSPNV